MVLVVYYLTGTGVQYINGAGTGVFNNLILEKTGGSVTDSANITVNGDLCLSGNGTGTRSILNIQSYNLALGSNAIVYSDTITGTTFNRYQDDSNRRSSDEWRHQ